MRAAIARHMRGRTGGNTGPVVPVRQRHGRGAFVDLFGVLTALRNLPLPKLLQKPGCGIANAFRIRSAILAGLRTLRHVYSIPPGQ